MQPNQSDLVQSRRQGREDAIAHMTGASRAMSRSARGPHRFMSEDSWVEIASQPSSSSLSSIGDEVITTGLNVQNRRHPRRRRRLQEIIANNMEQPPRPSSAAGSSQDEYDESSSESDRVMSSSNEDLAHQEESPPLEGDNEMDVDEDDEDDEDDTSTALGTGTSNTIFTPQPNAFTHPPSSQTSRTTSASLPLPDSYFPPPVADRLPTNRTLTARNLRRPSVSRSPRSSHTPYNMISPSHTYQPDHDAALRASLSTLLSCAAAARGLPKRDTPSRTTARRPPGDTVDTNTLRMVPESQLMGQDEPGPALPPRRYAGKATSSSSSAPSPPASVKPSAAALAKRKATRETSKDRNSKKSRPASTSRGPGVMDESAISPTLMTWMVSAGVVILFSAISFSAGFVFGREVGRIEAGGAGAADIGGSSNTCGQELAARADGLKRLRWSSGGSTSIRA